MPAQITVVLPKLGVSPSRDDPNFEDQADDMMGKMQPLQVSIDEFSVQANALALDVNAMALAANQSAAAAASAAQAAGATAWVSGKVYAITDPAVDPVDLFLYRKKTASSSSTTPPRLDPTNWKNVSVVPDVAAPLADAATIAWDAGAVQVPTIVLGGNRTIAAPTNLTPRTYVMFIKQDATGGRVPTFDQAFVFPDDIQPQISLEPNRITMFSFICDGTYLRASYLPGYTR